VLTPAEWAVLDGLRHGMSRRQIAERRGVSGYAIRYHARNIARKVGVTGVSELRYWPGIPAASAIMAMKWREHMVQAAAPEQQERPAALGPLGQVSLLARDIGRAEAFYRDRLGLAHLFTFGDLAFFACGATRLFLRQAADEWHPGSVLYFTVADIHASYQDLTSKGVAFHGAPHLIHRHDDGAEEWMAFFADTEGNTLALMSQVPPASPVGTASAEAARHAT
jgi:predicted enzyme related to lactoylglutathione lyase